MGSLSFVSVHFCYNKAVVGQVFDMLWPQISIEVHASLLIFLTRQFVWQTCKNSLRRHLLERLCPMSYVFSRAPLKYTFRSHHSASSTDSQAFAPTLRRQSCSRLYCVMLPIVDIASRCNLCEVFCGICCEIWCGV